jgi:hypothetical protein
LTSSPNGFDGSHGHGAEARRIATIAYDVCTSMSRRLHFHEQTSAPAERPGRPMDSRKN